MLYDYQDPTPCVKCYCALTSTYIHLDRSRLLAGYAQVKANSKPTLHEMLSVWTISLVLHK